MDWKLFTSTFALIFLAELGDKTQLTAFSMASGTNSKWLVFLGAALALIATTAIAVTMGGWIGQYVPEIWTKRAAGTLFVVLGVAYLVQSFR